MFQTRYYLSLFLLTYYNSPREVKNIKQNIKNLQKIQFQPRTKTYHYHINSSLFILPMHARYSRVHFLDYNMKMRLNAYIIFWVARDILWFSTFFEPTTTYYLHSTSNKYREKFYTVETSCRERKRQLAKDKGHC